ncbi:hypothetical protein [Microvirga tunisiensis]|uniref:Uncharacterized protein n=1 Tax=Microvirga tunisiensis TaxID=2108360 RepID=A0A5N7MGL8_9HYPH|nr:hypothetical protein [Microvirga tunisiensis]MPR07826.1 hypothetical protein [Microvirga tunisiensis]MPR26221.1 hypothetical protein [Microvirga tunisiensis]
MTVWIRTRFVLDERLDIPDPEAPPGVDHADRFGPDVLSRARQLDNDGRKDSLLDQQVLV